VTDEQQDLPLFPLGEVVLFPGMALPLHVFEERYKQMIGRCLEAHEGFGVVSSARAAKWATRPIRSR